MTVIAIGILIAGTLGQLALLVHCWARRGLPAARWLILLLGGILLWILGFVAEILTRDLESTMLAVRIIFLGIVVVPPSILALVLHAIGRADRLDRVTLGALWSVPCFTTLILWLPPLTPLFWTDAWLATDLPTLVTAKGPAYWLHIGHVWVVTLASVVIMGVRGLQQGLDRSSALILVAVTAPFVASLLDTFLGRAHLTLSSAPFALVLSGMLFHRALLRHGAWSLGSIVYETIVKQMRDAVVVVDGQGHIVAVNGAARAIPGVSRRMGHGEHYSVALAGYPEVASLLERGGEGTIETRATDGEDMVYQVGLTRLAGTEGDASGGVLVWHDVSAQRRAAELAEQAAAAKASFLASMSHEIRTPLNGVIPLVGLLLASDLGEDQRSMLETIDRSSQSLLRIINDILDLSKIEAGEMIFEEQDFDWVTLLRESVDMLSGKASEKSIGLRLEAGLGEHCWARGDALRLRQVLLNLIGNAIKFTQDGEVVVRARATAEDGDAFRVRVEVEDTGIGISPEALESIFDPFVQAEMSTTRRFGGTGLGLSVSRQIIERMGGRIRAESEAEAGSTFSFEVVLPRGRVSSEEGGAEGGRETAQGAGGHLATILVAEDNPVNQMVVRRLLERAGYRVAIAGDGREVLRRAEEQRFSLILMDCHMPELDGIAATRRIREGSGPCREVPIVALTAGAFEDDRDACLAAGMQDFVSKPIDVALLLGVIDRLAIRESPTPRRAGRAGPS